MIVMSMKFKCDECIPVGVADYIAQSGYDVDTVNQEGLSGASDREVWQAAQLEGRFLITTDLDFSDVRRFKPGTHHGILLMRVSQEGQTALSNIIRWLFTHYNPGSWSEALVIVTDHKLRIRPPSSDV